MDDETRARRHDEAWEHFMRAERRHLEDRRRGHLARLLDGPLPGESPEEPAREEAEEDRLGAEEGLVDLVGPDGELSRKHVDELAPEDRGARAEAERGPMNRTMGRQRGRTAPPGASR